MKKPHRASEARAADTQNIPYLRARPPLRRPNPEREWARYRALRAAEVILDIQTRYRHHLDNPGGRYEYR